MERDMGFTNSAFRMTLRGAVFAAVLLTAVLTAGCNTYSFTNSGHDLYRINKTTGAVTMIDGNHFIEVTSGDAEQKDPASPVTSNTISMEGLGNLQVEIRRKWRDGSMYYIVVITPMSETLKKAREQNMGEITLAFDDADGFEIETIPLNTWQMTQIVDGKDQPTGVETKGSKFMSRAVYDSLKDIDVRWAGFPGA